MAYQKTQKLAGCMVTGIILSCFCLSVTQADTIAYWEFDGVEDYMDSVGEYDFSLYQKTAGVNDLSDAVAAIDSVPNPDTTIGFVGDPNVNPSNEPMPNGGRINMGAYGNTAYASMSEWPIEEDNNRDGIVNMLDIANVAARWLEKLDWVE